MNKKFVLAFLIALAGMACQSQRKHVDQDLGINSQSNREPQSLSQKEELKRSLGSWAYVLNEVETKDLLQSEVAYLAHREKKWYPGISLKIDLPKGKLETVSKVDVSGMPADNFDIPGLSKEVVSLAKSNNIAEKRYFSNCQHQFSREIVKENLVPMRSESESAFQSRFEALKQLGVEFKEEEGRPVVEKAGGKGFLACKLDKIDIVDATTGKLVKITKYFKSLVLENASAEKDEGFFYFGYSAGKNLSINPPRHLSPEQLAKDELGAYIISFFSTEKETFDSLDANEMLGDDWDRSEYKFAISGIMK